MTEIFFDALKDSLRLLPFLLITYIVIEFLERSAGWKSRGAMHRAGLAAPFIGAVLGVLPQCGFSAAAAGLFAERIIGVGALVSVFLSTSDEMLPIFISSAVPLHTIVKLLLFKLIIAAVSGYGAHVIFSVLFKSSTNTPEDEEISEGLHSSCCHHGILYDSVLHTVKIFIYILIVTFVLNCAIDLIGEERITAALSAFPALSELSSALIGLIPNCASSVIITQMYLNGIISAGALMSGLLVNAGVGVLILLRLNKHPKENAAIIAYLYIIGVLWGIILELTGITF